MNDFKILRSSEETIAGTIASTAYAGQGFMYDPSDPGGGAGHSTATLTAATATRGYCLERDVIPESEMELRVLQREVFQTDRAREPQVEGSVMSCRVVYEAEVEGPELLTLSGTGSLAAKVTADVPVALGYASGKLREKQTADELVGYIRAVLTAELTGNTKRFLVEYANPAG